MSKKRNKKKPNPVYLKGLEEGENRAISKSSRKILHSIKEFEKMKGVGPKMMKNIYEAFGINTELSDEKEKELKRKWGRYND